MSNRGRFFRDIFMQTTLSLQVAMFNHNAGGGDAGTGIVAIFKI